MIHCRGYLILERKLMRSWNGNSFKLTPTITTKEIERCQVQEHYKNINEIHNEEKDLIGEEEKYCRLCSTCNKICGAGHSNMQLKV